MSKNLYMVPYDFSPLSQKALEYAIQLGKHVNAEIKLLHLAKDRKSGMIMKSKLDEIKNKTEVPYGVELSALTRVGNIFSDIGKITKEENRNPK